LPDETENILMPPALSLGSDKLEGHGFFVLDNSFDIYIWLGSQVHPDLCTFIFGQPFVKLTSGIISLRLLENPWSQRLCNILGKLRSLHANHPVVHLIKDDSDISMKNRFLQFLIEDKTVADPSQPSYIAWLSTLRDKVYANKGP
jgi:protein transport protein SEC24